METTQPPTSKVYAAISAVMESLAASGIPKDHQNNQQGGFKYRSIDQIYGSGSV